MTSTTPFFFYLVMVINLAEFHIFYMVVLLKLIQADKILHGGVDYLNACYQML